MKTLYIDESGDSNLNSCDRHYPIFVLTGVVIDLAKQKEIEEKIRKFKVNHFGTDKVILHTKEIIRKEGAFHFLHHPGEREKFYTALNRLVASLNFEICACLIDKKKYLKKYGSDAIDSYTYALHVLVEQFVRRLEPEERGVIKAEARGRIADNQIKIAWESLCNRGTKNMMGSEIRKQIDGFTIHSKRENLSGLQIADLVASPLGRHYLQKEIRDDYKVLEPKFISTQGQKSGILVFPK